MRAFLYITLGILFICLSIYNLYGGYELEKPIVAAFGFGGIIIGALLTLFGFSRRGSKKKAQRK